MRGLYQLMSDAGLNPFGAALLCESLLRSPLAAELRDKARPLCIFFPIDRSDCAGWAGVEMVLRPIPVHDASASPDLSTVDRTDMHRLTPATQITGLDQFFAAAEAAGITHWTPELTAAVVKRSDEIAASESLPDVVRTDAAPTPRPVWHRDNKAVYCALMLCGGHDVPESAVAEWTDEQARQAQDWALTEHIAASDNDDVQRLPMPAWVAGHPAKQRALTGTIDDLWSR